MDLLTAVAGPSTPGHATDAAVPTASTRRPNRVAAAARTRPAAASAGSGGQPAVKLSGPSPQQTARFVAIAGNIGAGKSTLTSFLESRFAIKPFYEPNDSNPYLTDFYGDMARYAFHSQMYFLSAKFRAHLELGRMLAQQPGTVFVQDRTIYEDAEIFARTLHTRGVMSARDFQTYQGMYHGIRDTLPRPDLLIYLRCSLRGLRRRIRARGRPEEQAMSPKYLSDLQDAYEDWFARYDLGPTLVIETEQLDYLANLIDRVELVTALEQLVRRA
jgi:deoxyadenosine/deoxycytidine kinase